jgi:hypothetical protein
VAVTNSAKVCHITIQYGERINYKGKSIDLRKNAISPEELSSEYITSIAGLF